MQHCSQRFSVGIPLERGYNVRQGAPEIVKELKFIYILLEFLLNLLLSILSTLFFNYKSNLSFCSDYWEPHSRGSELSFALLSRGYSFLPFLFFLYYLAQLCECASLSVVWSLHFFIAFHLPTVLRYLFQSIFLPGFFLILEHFPRCFTPGHLFVGFYELSWRFSDACLI